MADLLPSNLIGRVNNIVSGLLNIKGTASMIEKKGMEQQGQNPWPKLIKTLQQKGRKNPFPFSPVTLS